jgi:hypothetical protein
MTTNGGGNRGARGWRALAAAALINLPLPQVHAEGHRKLASEPSVAAAPTSAPDVAPAQAPPTTTVQDQLAVLYAKIQAENDKILDTQGRIADALDRTANLLGVTIGIGVLSVLLFAGLLMAMARAAKASASAARALPTLERAYVFLGKNVAVTLPDAIGPSPAVRIAFQASFTNHGRTPAVIRWINLNHRYLREPPSGVYEEHERHGVGIVIGAGDTHVLAESQLTLPRSEWRKAETGDGAIYLDGRIVYRDIFADQHETYFCRRYDIASRAFAAVESETLNRYD